VVSRLVVSSRARHDSALGVSWRYLPCGRVVRWRRTRGRSRTPAADPRLRALPDVLPVRRADRSL